MRSRDPEKMVIRTGLPDYAAVSVRRRDSASRRY